jgi:hypothetical protein
MKRILNFLFGSKKKNGKCKWWNHEYDDGKESEWMSGTGSFINGQQIEKKYYNTTYTCKKCVDTFSTDPQRVWW